MLDSILSMAGRSSLTTGEFMICAAVSVVLGVCLAGVHIYRNNPSKNFLLTLAILPAAVQAIIMMVNGNMGTGIAVMGAFGLVRFRSLPGNSREIVSIFTAMGIGLATAMGHLAVAVWLFLLVAVLTVAMVHIPAFDKMKDKKELKITIPENLDYYGIFDDLFAKYTHQSELLRVKTVNMGSLYELQYHVSLKDEKQEKAFLDEIRCRNGNLNLVCARVPDSKAEL